MYTVLARKWRPKTLAEVIGQPHVVRALQYALTHNQIHHAYLFSGTRGVGKTTLARILAKCLNCLHGPTATPCEQCTSCLACNDSHFIDLLEIDAASRTKVEDTRELLEGVQYAPTQGRYKIYLIDEIHMLSGHSFNALLKTLEEPPLHVKFLLATTEPQKLPATILSRCLQFHLKTIAPDLLTQHFIHILTTENILFDPLAISLISRAAEGSVRDGLSLLDQAIATGIGEVTLSSTRELLGTLDQQDVLPLLKALAAQNAVQLLTELTRFAQQGINFDALLTQLQIVLQQLACCQLTQDCNIPGLENKEQLLALAQQFSPETVQLYYQIALHGRRDLPFAPTPQSGAEMTLLRMLAFHPVAPPALDLIAKSSLAITAHPNNPKLEEQTFPASPHISSSIDTNSSHQDCQEQEIENKQNSAILSASKESWPATNDAWISLTNQLPLTGVTHALASHCSLQSSEFPHQITLQLDTKHAALLSKTSQQKLALTLSNTLGYDIKLMIVIGRNAVASPAEVQAQQIKATQAKNVQQLEQDTLVQGMQSLFNGTINPTSVREV